MEGRLSPQIDFIFEAVSDVPLKELSLQEAETAPPWLTLTYTLKDIYINWEAQDAHETLKRKGAERTPPLKDW